MTALVLAAQSTPAWPSGDGLSAVRAVMALLAVAALLGGFVWAARRGTFGPGARRRGSAVSVETAFPLGERRSVVILSVEGRRLLLGMSPTQVSLLAELQAAPAAFAEQLDARLGTPPGV